MTHPDSDATNEPASPPANRWSPIRFVVGFGIVALLGDFVYKGARSVVCPYLATLGAGAALVGVITGAGEAAALVLRLVSGPLADPSRRRWPITIGGYAFTMVAVPLLAVSTVLWQAITAVIGDRFGKAARSPAKGVMLVAANSGVGRSRAFAIQEALDQAVAVAGPLVVAAMIAMAGFRLGLAVMAIPAAAAQVVLVLLRRAAPHAEAYETARAVSGERSVG